MFYILIINNVLMYFVGVLINFFLNYNVYFVIIMIIIFGDVIKF